MLVMVCGTITGLSIREVTMTYRERQSFDLRVVLARQEDDPNQLESYHSDDINDAALLRHLGIAAIGGKPLFDGFFPLRLHVERAIVGRLTLPP